MEKKQYYYEEKELREILLIINIVSIPTSFQFKLVSSLLSESKLIFFNIP